MSLRCLQCSFQWARGTLSPCFPRSARAAQLLEPARKDPFRPRPGSWAGKSRWFPQAWLQTRRELANLADQTEATIIVTKSGNLKVLPCSTALFAQCVAQRPHCTRWWGAPIKPSRLLARLHVSLEFCAGHQRVVTLRARECGAGSVRKRAIRWTRVARLSVEFEGFNIPSIGCCFFGRARP